MEEVGLGSALFFLIPMLFFSWFDLGFISFSDLGFKWVEFCCWNWKFSHVYNNFCCLIHLGNMGLFDWNCDGSIYMSSFLLQWWSSCSWKREFYCNLCLWNSLENLECHHPGVWLLVLISLPFPPSPSPSILYPFI